MAGNGVLLTVLLVNCVWLWPEQAHVFASQSGLDSHEKSANLVPEELREEQDNIVHELLKESGEHFTPQFELESPILGNNVCPQKSKGKNVEMAASVIFRNQALKFQNMM
ncbi:hypothetical protein PoB_000552800 [Plakobranchus ocellatus]|uniref:Uncharacterized protein n=1 Tax=Plakobranchus ocellatus TaxID=259542 RepID=A0AAV3Y933_9GAST|nr:hypothetical protein PoB_000552800 [Plakobranchus ocellatus]